MENEHIQQLLGNILGILLILMLIGVVTYGALWVWLAVFRLWQ